MKALDEHIRSGGKKSFVEDVRYRHKDGSTVIVTCQGRVIEFDEKGAPLRLLGIHTDVTANRLRTRAALERKVTDYLAHEVRNPLTSAVGATRCIHEALGAARWPAAVDGSGSGGGGNSNAKMLSLETYRDNGNSLRGNVYRIDGKVEETLRWTPDRGRLISFEASDTMISIPVPVRVPEDFSNINIERGAEMSMVVRIDREGTLVVESID